MLPSTAVRVTPLAALAVAVSATLPALGLLGEVPDAITLAGGSLVLAGIYATTRERDSRA